MVPQDARADTKLGTEGTGEMRDLTKARIQSDTGDRQVGHHQLLTRPTQPISTYISHRCDPQRLPEAAGKVFGRQVYGARDRGDI